MDTPTTPAPGGRGLDVVPLAAPKATIRPGRIWYLAPLLALLGGVVWLVVGLLSINSSLSAFPRVAIPGSGQVNLNHAGVYVVYYEGPGAESGQIPGYRVRVVPASASAAVESLAPVTGSVTYSFGSHRGRAVFNMRVSHPGRFTVVTVGPDNPSAGGDFAFGGSLVGGIAGTAVPSALLILAGIAGLVVIFIIRTVKISRARSAAPAWSPPGVRP